MRKGRHLRLEPLEERTVLSGIVLTSINGEWDEAFDSFVAPDGDIVVTGRTDPPDGGADLAVLRYDADGVLDTSFGDGDGVVTTSISRYGTGGYAVAEYSDDRIVVAGYASTKRFLGRQALTM